jgi:hypothetical protein
MQRFKIVLAALAVALLGTAPAGAADGPVPGYARLPPTENFAGPGEHAADGEIAHGAVIASAPLEFDRTGVLMEDVTGTSIMVRGVLAPKGSPAIFLGGSTSMMTQGGAPMGTRVLHGEFWCFLPARAGGKRQTLCLNVFGKASFIGPDKANPYLFTGWTVSGTAPNAASGAPMADGPADLGEVKYEYVFAGWGRDHVNIDVRAGGFAGERIWLPRGPDGSALLKTPGGVLRITPSPPDTSRARLAFVPAGG